MLKCRSKATWYPKSTRRLVVVTLPSAVTIRSLPTGPPPRYEMSTMASGSMPLYSQMARMLWWLYCHPQSRPTVNVMRSASSGAACGCSCRCPRAGTGWRRGRSGRRSRRAARGPVAAPGCGRSSPAAGRCRSGSVMRRGWKSSPSTWSEGDDPVDVVLREEGVQQLLDQAARAGAQVAIVVRALGEQDGVDHPVRTRFGVGEDLGLQPREVDLDGRADRGGRRAARRGGLVDQLLGVERKLHRGIGDRARAAPDAPAVLDHRGQVGADHRPASASASSIARRFSWADATTAGSPASMAARISAADARSSTMSSASLAPSRSA